MTAPNDSAPELPELDDVVMAAWALVRSGPNFDGRDKHVRAAAMSYASAAITADRERRADGASLPPLDLAAVVASDPRRGEQPQAEPREPALSPDSAEAMGATGSPAVEAERLAFEAWVKGHCWGLDAEWNGKGYISDVEAASGGGYVCPHAMSTRRMWAAWRDRAALSGAQGEQRKGLSDPIWRDIERELLSCVNDGCSPALDEVDCQRLLDLMRAHGIPADAQGGAVWIGGAMVCCPEFDREPCHHKPSERCKTCPGNAQKGTAS